MRLANRRFVSLYFDLSTRGAAGDADARAFVVKARPAYGGGGVPTPDVLFMTPAGKELGSVSNYATSQQVLAKMQEVLKAHPQWNKPSAAEKELADPIARAELRTDLLDFEGARKELAATEGDRAQYLLGRLARRERRWDEMEKHFALVKDPAFGADVRMERAYRLWDAREHTKLLRHLTGFPKESPRFTEARYHEGLALYHLKKRDEAIKVWASTIKACPQDPWIYRSDWAYCDAKAGDGRRRMFSTSGPKTSLLNRHGYMGRGGNPDLR